MEPTTQIYTWVAIGKLKEAYEQSHPAAHLKRTAREPPSGDGEEDLREAYLAALAAEGEEEFAEAEGSRSGERREPMLQCFCKVLPS